jgi:hypothetical protein
VLGVVADTVEEETMGDASMGYVKKIMLATPSIGGYSGGFLDSLLEQWAAWREAGIWKMRRGVEGCSCISSARNQLAHVFMQSDCERVLMVDSDISWSPKTVEYMLDFDQDFVVGAVPTRRLLFDRFLNAVKQGDPNPKRWIYDFNIQHMKETEADIASRIHDKGFLKIASGGVAFALLKRSVFERIKKSIDDRPGLDFDRLTYRETDGERAYAYFDPFCKDGVPYPEDAAFCKRWRDVGGDIWCIMKAPFTHEGSMRLEGDFGEWLLANADVGVQQEIEKIQKPLIVRP